MIVGKSGAGKSTLGNQLLNHRPGTDNDVHSFFKEGGGTAGVSMSIEEYTSSDGTLKVIDTPGIPDPSSRNTVKYFDAIVNKIRVEDAINLLIVLVKEDRTDEKQFEQYRTLLKQFNYIPCEKLMVCRQAGYSRRSPTDQARQAKSSEGIQFADDILSSSCMDMPFMLHMSGRDQEATSSISRILGYARGCPLIVLGSCPSLRTYSELKAFVGKLASKNDRLRALEQGIEAQRRAVEDSQWWLVFSQGCCEGAKKAVANSSGFSVIVGAVARPFIYFTEKRATRASNKLRKAEEELASGSVDADMLKEAQDELNELHALAS